MQHRRHLVQTKIVRAWNDARRLSAADCRLGEPAPPGSIVRLVMPGSMREYSPDLPPHLARYLLEAADWFLDHTGQPALMANLVRDINQSMQALRGAA